jgi:SAM-dependent methyltransferase
MDAPWVPWIWFVIAAAYAVWAVLTALSGPWWASAIIGVVALAFAVCGALFLHSSVRGKFLVWDEVLRAVPADRDAALRVLDLGCGRGAVSIMTALRFPRAQITGIDLWRSVDQSGNSQGAAARNAEANGVADRIGFDTGDMTALPYPDASFDLVTASLSIHNIRGAEGRAAAVREAWRVLAPGGTLAIVDISRTREYVDTLQEAAGTSPGSVRRAGVGWRMWWSGPWMPTATLEERKAGAAPGHPPVA